MWRRLKTRHKILSILVLLFIAVLIAVPIIAKNYVNGNGEELIGRKITLQSLSINYFTGALNLGDLLIYESNDTDTFLYVNDLHVNPNLIAILRKNYVIENVEIDRLKCNTILKDSTFNFQSIINHFTDSTQKEEESTPISYAVENISLSNCYLSYVDLNLNSKIAVKELNASLPSGISSDNPELRVESDFKFTSGGSIDSKFDFNLENGGYDLDLKSNQVNLNILFPYLKDFMLANELSGFLNTDLLLHGNTEESANMDISGSLSVENIVITDSIDVKVMGLGSLHVVADSINPAKDIYQLSAIKFDSPYARFEMYPETDNFSQLLMMADSTETVSEAESESNVFVMIKDYVVETLQGIKASNFSIDTVEIRNVEMLYSDQSMIEPFNYHVSETDITAYNVKSDADSLIVDVSSLLNNKGRLSASGILHPQKPEDVTINLVIDEFAMEDISPYFHQYVAYPVTDGSFKMTCNLIVKDKQLMSSNDLSLKSFMLGKKQNHKNAYKVPLKLGVAMLKDRDGDINLNIPVVGDLADPKYKVWKTVGKIFKELLLKAASSPYKLATDGLKTDEESTRKIVIDNLVEPLNDRSLTKLDNLAKVLVEKPSLVLSIDPYYNSNTESKKLGLLLAKADYISIEKKTSFTSDELLLINNVNEKDSLFLSHVNQTLPVEKHVLTLEEKSVLIFTESYLKQQVEQLVSMKLNAMHDRLKSQGAQSTQVKELSVSQLSQYDNSTSGKVHYDLMFDVIE